MHEEWSGGKRGGIVRDIRALAFAERDEQRIYVYALPRATAANEFDSNPVRDTPSFRARKSHSILCPSLLETMMVQIVET